MGKKEERDRALTDFKMGRLDVRKQLFLLSKAETQGYYSVLTSFDLARMYIEDLDSLALSCVFVDEVNLLSLLLEDSWRSQKLTLGAQSQESQLADHAGLPSLQVSHSFWSDGNCHRTLILPTRRPITR